LSAPIPVATLEAMLPLHPVQSDARDIIQTAIYYGKRAAILEGQLEKSRAAIREIVSETTTIRVQAALPPDEDPFPQDPNEV
jgi:hypothetical protein